MVHLIVLDVFSRSHETYKIRPDDIEKFEDAYGKIPSLYKLESIME